MRKLEKKVMLAAFSLMVLGGTLVGTMQSTEAAANPSPGLHHAQQVLEHVHRENGKALEADGKNEEGIHGEHRDVKPHGEHRPDFNGKRPECPPPGFDGKKPEGPPPNFDGKRPECPPPDFDGKKPECPPPGFDGKRPEGPPPDFENGEHGNQPGFDKDHRPPMPPPGDANFDKDHRPPMPPPGDATFDKDHRPPMPPGHGTDKETGHENDNKIMDRAF